MYSKALFFLTVLCFSSLLSAFPENDKPALAMKAEDIIKEQVQLLYKRHKNTAFSWLRNIFHDCFVESCDASLLLDSTRRMLSEETDMSFGMRSFRCIETIKEALERECPNAIPDPKVVQYVRNDRGTPMKHIGQQELVDRGSPARHRQTDEAHCQENNPLTANKIDGCGE